jgi:hypothetical protein
MIATAAAGVMGAAPTDTYPGLRRTRPVHHTVGVCWCDLGHFECLLLRRPVRGARPARRLSCAGGGSAQRAVDPRERHGRG